MHSLSGIILNAVNTNKLINHKSYKCACWKLSWWELSILALQYSKLLRFDTTYFWQQNEYVITSHLCEQVVMFYLCFCSHVNMTVVMVTMSTNEMCVQAYMLATDSKRYNWLFFNYKLMCNYILDVIVLLMFLSLIHVRWQDIIYWESYRDEKGNDLQYKYVLGWVDKTCKPLVRQIWLITGNKYTTIGQQHNTFLCDYIWSPDLIKCWSDPCYRIMSNRSTALGYNLDAYQ